MDLSALKTEIENFKEDVKSFIITVNSNSSDFSQKEINDLSNIAKKLSHVCEACHNSLSLLYSTESLNDGNYRAIELWNLTRAFEYTQRKYEIRVLTQKRREAGHA